MKSSLRSVYFALFLIMCIANCIIIKSNVNNLNSTISKTESLKQIKFHDTIKVVNNEPKVSKEKKERLKKSLQKLNVFKFEEFKEKENCFDFIKNNLPTIISFSALSLGFIFAGIFAFIAFLFSE